MFTGRTTTTAAISALINLFALAASESTLTGTITGYGSASNDPTGSNEVCCGLSGGEHAATYEDPGSCASDNSKYPVNTKIYIPGLEKYFIVQDSCADCVNQAVHFDLWMGPNSYTNYNNLLACAESGGASSGTIILDPAPGYTVDSTPLMDPSGKCDANVDYSRKSPSSSGGGGGMGKNSPVLPSSPGGSSTTLATATATKSLPTNAFTPPASALITTGGGGSSGTCDWAGHCNGASCRTYNDCGNPFSCVNGVCT